MKTRILVVEDEKSWSDLVKNILKDKGYDVTVAETADEALREIKLAGFDMAILDVKLEGISGIQLCEWLRREPVTAAIPILMLTTLQNEGDKIKGFESGADDYLCKPFGHKELAARVLALLRRAGPNRAPDRQMTAHGVILDLDRHEVTVKGKKVELRPKEFDLLVLLMEKQGKVVSRSTLAETVWGRQHEITSQNITQHVKNLRQALGPAGEYIETVETLGYKFKE